MASVKRATKMALRKLIIISILSSATCLHVDCSRTGISSKKCLGVCHSPRVGHVVSVEGDEPNSQEAGDAVQKIMDSLKPKQYEPDEQSGMSSPFDFGAILRGIQKGLGDLGTAPELEADAVAEGDNENAEDE